MKNKILYIVVGLIIVITVIIVCFINDSYSSYVPNDNPLGDGIKNIDLLYFGRNLNYDSSYKNIITYLDSNNNDTGDIFIDSFIIIPASAYKGRVSGNNVGSITFSDITGYLNDEFKQLEALNKSIKDINSSDLRINVFLSIICPSNNCNSNGIQTFIDSSIQMFYSDTYDVSNLNLIGFYWYAEDVKNSAEEEVVISFNSIVHEKGYKSIWVPYVTNYNTVSAGEADFNDWYRYGYSKYNFDYVSLQSGYYFHGDDIVWLNFRKGVKRLPFVNDEASNLGMGIELEVDNSIFINSEKCSLFKDYLLYAIGKNAGWNKGINVFYMPNYLTDIKSSRISYDLIYKYVNGTLSTDDVNSLSCDKEYYSKYENISKGKTYSLVPFVDSDGNNINQSYMDNGTKLTDGVYGDSSFGNEWVGFTRNISSKLKYVDVDLNRVESSISYFEVELEKNESAGIYLPTNPINVYISDDGNNYKLVGTLEETFNNSIYKDLHYYSLNLGNETVSGRYIRFSYETNNEPFVFFSEVVVGKTSTITLSDNSKELPLGSTETFSVDIDNGDISDLDISVDNDDIVTTTIDSDNKISINAVEVGDVNIIIQDKRYGNKAVYNVNVFEEIIDFDSSLKVIDDDLVIDKIRAGSTISDMLKNINSNVDFVFVDSNNIEITDDNSILKTGDKIVFSKYNGNISYTVAVRGDSNGDGFANIDDFLNISDIIINNRKIDKVYYNAADVNDDDNINVIDIVWLANDIKKKRS